MTGVVTRLAEHPRRGRIVLGSFVVMLAVGALALPSLGDMSDRGVGIVAYEVAGTSAKAAELNAELGADGRAAARRSIWLDYGYLVAYGAFAAVSCLVLAARAAERRRTGLARLGRALALAAVVAAACDAVENAALLRVAGGTTDQPWPRIAASFATVKFALLAAALVYAVVAVVLTSRAGREVDQGV
jgi:hypothetical protein